MNKSRPDLIGFGSSQKYQMRAYLIALEIAELELGKVYDHLPLHCTLMHWFYADLTSERLVEIVRPVVASTSPISLTTVGTAQFGPSNSPQNTFVDLVVKTKELILLHANLKGALDANGVEYSEPLYVGDGYDPHITQQPDLRFGQNRTHISRAMYIVEALDAKALQRKCVRFKVDFPH